MGCDIHSVVELRAITSYTRGDAEIRRLQRSDSPLDAIRLERLGIREGEWQFAARHSHDDPKTPYSKWVPYAWSKESGDWVHSMISDPPFIWDDRDYDAFAHLAGVRNRYDVIPIALPRGLPSPDPDYWYGDHSFSWVTMREIIDHPGWNQKIQYSGLVAFEDYARMKETGKMPDSWCQGSSDTVVSEAIADATLAAGEWISGHVRTSWSRGREYGVVKMAKAWVERYGDAVRFVFGFDS